MSLSLPGIFEFVRWLSSDEMLVFVPADGALARLNIRTGAYTVVPLTTD